MRHRITGLTGALVIAGSLVLHSSPPADAAPDSGNVNCVTPPEFYRLTGGTENAIERQLGVDRGKVVAVNNSGPRQLSIHQYAWCNHYAGEGVFQVLYSQGEDHTRGIAATWLDYTCLNPKLVICGHQPESERVL